MVKVLFTKTHCIALCNRGHIIRAEPLPDFYRTGFYDMVLDNRLGKRTKLDDLAERCNGEGHHTEMKVVEAVK